MKLFDVGSEAHGIIAIGQEATGVIAFGQFATGFVAVGQMARGVIVVGQLAIGFFALGQLGIGLHTSVAMFGVAGRKGIGAVWKIFPKEERAKDEFVPEIVDVAELVDARRDAAWIEAALEPRGEGLAIRSGGQLVDLEMEPALAAEAKSLAMLGRVRARIRVHAEQRVSGDAASYRDQAPTERVLCALEIEAMPVPERARPEFWIRLGGRTLLLSLLWAIYWFTAGADVWNGIAPESLHLPGSVGLG